MLFSTHSVNHTLSSESVNPRLCEFPQSFISPQSDQLGFFEGMSYSINDSVFGLKTASLFAVC